MMCVNRQPVGIFIVMPPTLYAKVWTGVDPTAPAYATEELVSTRAHAAAKVTKSLDRYSATMNNPILAMNVFRQKRTPSPRSRSWLMGWFTDLSDQEVKR